jgi:thiol:disulfide interchange protein DsbC
MKTNKMSFANKLLSLLLSTLCSVAHAGETEIRQSLQSKFPNIGKLEHVVKTPYSGLYEIVVGEQLLYTDEQGLYLFDGSIIDVKTRTDLSDQRRHQLFAIEFDKLPLELAVKRVKGNGQRKMAYFTDPNCGYCKKLEKELTKVNNVTLYMFMYPIFPGSEEIVRNVRCAKDPIKAWDEQMQKGISPANVSCKVPTDKIIALAKKLKVNGTPNLIFADGTQVPGYLPAEELEKHLNQADKK